MATATQLAIDRAAAALGGVTDYRLAKILGVRQTALSKYRLGQRQLDDGIAVQLAELAGMNPAQLLAEIQAERSKDEAARKEWMRLAKLAQAACLMLAILAGVQVTTMAPDVASEAYFSGVSAFSPTPHSGAGSEYYVKYESAEFNVRWITLAALFVIFLTPSRGTVRRRRHQGPPDAPGDARESHGKP